MDIAILVLVSVLVILALGALLGNWLNARSLKTGNALRAGEVVDQIFNEQITQIPPEERTPEQLDHKATMAENAAKKKLHDERKDH